jgi:cystine transport system permease protein
MIGLSLNTAAYASETLRAAISSIDKGQWEAAASIGMTPWQTLRRAILPQAARVALPPLSNSFISLVKDTSLAATIQVPELFRQAQLITSYAGSVHNVSGRFAHLLGYGDGTLCVAELF